MRGLDGTVAVVTGAGTGIGRAVVHTLVEADARVHMWGRRLDVLRDAAGGLDADRVCLTECDVSDRDQVREAVDRSLGHWGEVGLLVNNAGINTNPRSVADVDPSDWDRTVDINLTGVFNVTRALLPSLRARRSGTVINVASVAGLRASKVAGAAYSATKHGVVALSKQLNEEEVENGIRSCAICPGEVETPILDQRVEPVSAARRAAMLQPDDVAEAVRFVAALPGRACVPLLVIKPTVQSFS